MSLLESRELLTWIRTLQLRDTVDLNASFSRTSRGKEYNFNCEIGRERGVAAQPKRLRSAIVFVYP
jgi:hypothetical protein